MEKKPFEKPEITVIEFDLVDIITTSGFPDLDEGEVELFEEPPVTPT